MQNFNQWEMKEFPKFLKTFHAVVKVIDNEKSVSVTFPITEEDMSVSISTSGTSRTFKNYKEITEEEFLIEYKRTSEIMEGAVI